MTEANANRQPAGISRVRRFGPWAGLAVVVVAVGGGWLWSSRHSGTPPAEVLLVNGRVEGDTAAVGTKAGGLVKRVVAAEGENMEAGQLIAELTSVQLEARLEQAEHILHTAKERQSEAEAHAETVRRELETARVAVRQAKADSLARIGEAEAALEASRARSLEAQAELEEAIRDRQRIQRLFDRRVASADTLDEAKTREQVRRAAATAAEKDVRRAEQSLERARASRVDVQLRESEARALEAQLQEALAAVSTAKARVQSEEANVTLARADVEDTRVVAPFAGTVLEKLVEAGEVIAAGTPIVTLVDLSRLYAKVYVSGTDIGKVKIGDPARLYVDAFPDRHFTASVSQIAQQAEFTPRDIHMPDERAKLVFAVKLSIDNPGGTLKPGMPVDGRIRWSSDLPWGDGTD